ncbi:MAG: hypothetical protein WKF73_08225 [Nocardioidaceae bacterium]
MDNVAPPTELIGLLVRLREGLVTNPLPFEAADAPAARAERSNLVKQLDDYIVPRLEKSRRPYWLSWAGRRAPASPPWSTR